MNHRLIEAQIDAGVFSALQTLRILLWRANSEWLNTLTRSTSFEVARLPVIALQHRDVVIVSWGSIRVFSIRVRSVFIGF